MEICKRAIGLEKYEAGHRIHLDAADLYLVFVTQRILRVRVSFDRTFPEASYVLAATAWPDRLDEFMGKDRVHLKPVTPTVTETEEAYEFAGSDLLVRVEKDPLCLRIFDGKREIYATIPGAPFQKDSNQRLIHYSRMKEEDCFYGFGERTGKINKNYEFIRERATDSWAYDAEKCNSMYKHIPFYIHLERGDGSRKAAGKGAAPDRRDPGCSYAMGMFYHNLYESVFNLGGEKSNYWPRYSYFQTDGGDLDLFLLCEGDMQKVVDDYTFLTGRPALLPKRALGYQGSSMYYSELEKDCDEALLGFIDQVREKDFPIDGFHLSSGYTTQENNKRCVFTWNKERFRDPEAFFAAMKEKGAQTVPNVKPSILLVHPLREELEKEELFVKDSKDPHKPSVGGWWGGPGIAFDFTDPRTRKVWKKLLTDTVIDLGTDSIWDDNCEYDGVWDKDALCDYDGAGGTIGGLKPVMCNIMNRLAHEAVREHDPKKRPYVVCRSGGPGVQKYAQNWVGDNFTSWKTLRFNIASILGMGLSGQPNEGADIGGFAGPAPSEELFLRWVQHGIFQPRFSIHSASSDNTVTEPWMYSRQTDRIRNAIKLRYRMIPLFYALEAEAHRSGAPIMRPLVYEFQEDEKVYEEGCEFLLGPSLLVANVLEEGQKEKEVYLPGTGTRWYALDDTYTEYEGGETIRIKVDEDSIPRFLREGGILPMASNQPMNLEKDPVTGLSLTLAPSLKGEESSFTLYEDDGVSNDFEQGIYRKTKITMSGTEAVKVVFEAEGEYADPVESVKVTLIHKEKAPLFVSLDGRQIPHFLDRRKFEEAGEGWYYSQTGRAALIKYANPLRTLDRAELLVSFKEFDLIGM